MTEICQQEDSWLQAIAQQSDMKDIFGIGPFHESDSKIGPTFTTLDDLCAFVLRQLVEYGEKLMTHHTAIKLEQEIFSCE